MSLISGSWSSSSRSVSWSSSSNISWSSSTICGSRLLKLTIEIILNFKTHSHSLSDGSTTRTSQFGAIDENHGLDVTLIIKIINNTSSYQSNLLNTSQSSGDLATSSTRVLIHGGITSSLHRIVICNIKFITFNHIQPTSLSASISGESDVIAADVVWMIQRLILTYQWLTVMDQDGVLSVVVVVVAIISTSHFFLDILLLLKHINTLLTLYRHASTSADTNTRQNPSRNRRQFMMMDRNDRKALSFCIYHKKRPHSCADFNMIRQMETLEKKNSQTIVAFVLITHIFVILWCWQTLAFQPEWEDDSV